jgi:acyl carrier protein
MAKTISFDQFAEFVREWAGLRKQKNITPETLFERDLGITGDDGCELLEAVEKHFDVTLHSEEDGYRETFNLTPGEYLFHSEGGFMPPVHESNPLISLFNSEPVSLSTENVRAFTVGELYPAICDRARSSQG